MQSLKNGWASCLQASLLYSRSYDAWLSKHTLERGDCISFLWILRSTNIVPKDRLFQTLHALGVPKIWYGPYLKSMSAWYNRIQMPHRFYHQSVLALLMFNKNVRSTPFFLGSTSKRQSTTDYEVVEMVWIFHAHISILWYMLMISFSVFSRTFPITPTCPRWLLQTKKAYTKLWYKQGCDFSYLKIGATPGYIHLSL